MSSYPLRIDTHPGPKPAPAPRTGIPSTPLSALYTPFHTNRRPDPDTPSEVHAESEKSAAEALESVLKRLSPTRKTLDIDAASRSARTPSPTEDRKIVAEQYEIEKTIGEGAYGKVKLAIHLPTGQKVALKFLNRHLIHTTRGTSERILREILVLASLRHPNIVALLDVINSPENIILVLEYVGGGEVFDRVNRRSEQNEGKGIGEDEARRVLLQILGAVEYAHACGVVHRDLKLENLLLDDQDNVKIIDYGFATIIQPDNLLDTFCGSISYAAPEMLCGHKYAGESADIWSLGVILYTMVCGKMPFDERNVKKMLVAMLERRFDLPDHISENCKQLVTHTLQPKPARRITVPQMRAHPWTTDNGRIVIPPPVEHPNEVTVDMDQEVLEELVRCGYDREEVGRWVESGERVGSIGAAWFLVQRKLGRVRACSGCSDIFWF